LRGIAIRRRGNSYTPPSQHGTGVDVGAGARSRVGACASEGSTATPKQKPVPYGVVALLWAQGKTVSQISDEMGWTRPKSKFPYSYTYGVLKTLRKGVSRGLITFRINEKRKTPAADVGSQVCPLCSRRLVHVDPDPALYCRPGIERGRLSYLRSHSVPGRLSRTSDFDFLTTLVTTALNGISRK
jgi:hypothetical protein